jgi:hypothetical protein
LNNKWENWGTLKDSTITFSFPIYAEI